MLKTRKLRKRSILSGTQCVKPIDIVELVLYTDSLVSLNWISNAVNKLDKKHWKVTSYTQNTMIIHEYIQLLNNVWYVLLYLKQLLSSRGCVMT